MTTTARPRVEAVHDCPRCRMFHGEIPPGPFTPSEFQALGLAAPTVPPSSDDPLTTDPGVAAAERELAEARAVVDAAYQVWLRAIAEHRSAQLLGGDGYIRNEAGDIVGFRPGLRADSGRVAELALAVEEAKAHRDGAQQQYVHAHDALRRAQWRAQVKAARNGGRNGKGRRGRG